MPFDSCPYGNLPNVIEKTAYDIAPTNIIFAIFDVGCKFPGQVMFALSHFFIALLSRFMDVFSLP